MAQEARRVSIDERTTAKYEQAGISGEYNQNRFSGDKTRKVQFDTDEEAANDANYQVDRQPQRQMMQGGQTYTQTSRDTVTLQNKKKGKATATDRIKASAVNTAMMSWLVPLYSLVQIPFAIMSLVFFGFLYLYLEIEDSVADLEEGFFGFLFKGFSYAATTISGALSQLTGGLIDLGKIFDAVTSLPGNFWTTTHFIVLGMGIFILLTLKLIYDFSGINSLSGKKAGLKQTAFMLCVIGYSTPVLNLFPWFLAWTLVVWKFPK